MEFWVLVLGFVQNLTDFSHPQNYKTFYGQFCTKPKTETRCFYFRTIVKCWHFYEKPNKYENETVDGEDSEASELRDDIGSNVNRVRAGMAKWKSVMWKTVINVMWKSVKKSASLGEKMWLSVKKSVTYFNQFKILLNREKMNEWNYFNWYTMKPLKIASTACLLPNKIKNCWIKRY